MKTSNSVFCAVVVSVLGLFAALSAPQAFAQHLDVYPGDTCVKLFGAANITRNTLGGITNESPVANLFVSCSIVNDAFRQLSYVYVMATDRNPGPIISDNLICNVIQVKHINPNSGYIISMAGNRTSGASNDLQVMTFLPPFIDPTNPTGPDSTNFLRCLLPRLTSDGNSSAMHSYGVSEGPIGMLQAMIPPEVQESQARAVVEERERRINRGLETEKEDPAWSQRSVTSWTQVFQQEDIKEELKGIQLRNIECRTTLCRLNLALTAPPQGGTTFEEALSKLMLFAPWQGSGFGKIDNPDGQAPTAVLYIARERHSLP